MILRIFSTLNKKCIIELNKKTVQYFSLREDLYHPTLFKQDVGDKDSELFHRQMYLNTPSKVNINDLSHNFRVNQQELDEMGIKLSPIDYGDESNRVIFIRHGYSCHNYLIDKYIKKYERIQYLQFNPDHKQQKLNQIHKQIIKDKLFANPSEFLDSPLHPYGVIQCQNKAPTVHNLDIDCVYVSPMQRTMQTCVELFKDHPNKNSIKFIVQPMLAEQLTKLSDIFDQKRFIDFLKHSYNKNRITFNCRYFYQHQWQANLVDEKYLKMPCSDSESDQEGQQYIKIDRQLADTNKIMNIMEYHKNQPLERNSSFLKRVILTNKHIEKTAKLLQENKSSHYNSKRKKICIISHQYFIDTLFRKCLGQKNRPIDNCSLIYQSYN